MFEIRGKNARGQKAINNGQIIWTAFKNQVQMQSEGQVDVFETLNVLRAIIEVMPMNSTQFWS